MYIVFTHSHLYNFIYYVAFVSVSPEGNITVLPAFHITNVGEDTTFTCESLGGPGNTVQWFRNGNLLHNMTDDILNLSITTPSTDGGSYTCLVKNAAGNGSATSNLYVEPVIIVQPTNIYTTNGSTVNFSCEADGYPMPTYHWEKEQQDGSFIEVPASSNQLLVFDPVLFDDTGSYLCIATINFPIGSISNASSTSVITTLSGKFYIRSNYTNK